MVNNNPVFHRNNEALSQNKPSITKTAEAERFSFHGDERPHSVSVKTG